MSEENAVVAKHAFRIDDQAQVADVDFTDYCSGPFCDVCLNGWCRFEPGYDWTALRKAECPGPLL